AAEHEPKGSEKLCGQFRTHCMASPLPRCADSMAKRVREIKFSTCGLVPCVPSNTPRRSRGTRRIRKLSGADFAFRSVNVDRCRRGRFPPKWRRLLGSGGSGAPSRNGRAREPGTAQGTSMTIASRARRRLSMAFLLGALAALGASVLGAGARAQEAAVPPAASAAGFGVRIEQTLTQLGAARERLREPLAAVSVDEA